MGLDADLTAYYNAEDLGGHRSAHGEFRAQLRQRFRELIRSERRNAVIDVGAGPGLDTIEWQGDGFTAVGVDLAPANAEAMRQRGLAGLAGSLYHLPFRTGAFDALWTMSTFVHVPHERFDEAMRELIRVVQPGAPVGIGTWGGKEFEGVPEFGDLRPYRFFSLASHVRWRNELATHGTVETFETYHANTDSDWEYQFAVVRARR